MYRASGGHFALARVALQQLRYPDTRPSAIEIGCGGVPVRRMLAHASLPPSTGQVLMIWLWMHDLH